MLRGGGTEEYDNVGDESEKTKGAANTGQTTIKDVLGYLSARRRSSSSHREHSKVVQDQPSGFWEKGVWPGNSPDLLPIEKVWAIVQDQLDMMEPATPKEALVRNLQ